MTRCILMNVAQGTGEFWPLSGCCTITIYIIYITECGAGYRSAGSYLGAAL